jgi:hypothetical protein
MNPITGYDCRVRSLRPKAGLDIVRSIVDGETYLITIGLEDLVTAAGTRSTVCALDDPSVGVTWMDVVTDQHGDGKALVSEVQYVGVRYLDVASVYIIEGRSAFGEP